MSLKSQNTVRIPFPQIMTCVWIIFTELCPCDQYHVYFSTQWLGSEDSVADTWARHEANKQLT